MRESVIQLEDGWFFIRHTGVNRRPALLFIHGLGESGLCFDEAFRSPELKDCGLVVPDMPGCARSSHAFDGDYGMETQVRRLRRLVDHLGLESFYVVGHSLGGDLGVLMASCDNEGRVKGLVNVEGNLTPHDTFISGKAAAAAESGDFTGWFEEDFKEKMVLKGWGSRWESCRRYYASLRFCRPEAFLAEALEICERNRPLPGRTESLTGTAYAGLQIPKVFCWGSESLAQETLEYLEAASLRHRRFEPAFHWLMIDRAEEFYGFLSDFIRSPV
ncbi:MAG: alpha/beta fold hydrolase [Bacillota bacterium]